MEVTMVDFHGSPSKSLHTALGKNLPQRGLAKEELGGVIFGCTEETMAECFALGLFGLPACHSTYVSNIEIGLPLFLFDYNTRTLHGVFRAASNGGWNLNPYAWKTLGTGRGYPAQVRFMMGESYRTLPESVFSQAIKDNYTDETKFMFELTKFQTQELIRLYFEDAGIPFSPCYASIAGAEVCIDSRELQDETRDIGFMKYKDVPLNDVVVLKYNPEGGLIEEVSSNGIENSSSVDANDGSSEQDDRVNLCLQHEAKADQNALKNVDNVYEALEEQKENDCCSDIGQDEIENTAKERAVNVIEHVSETEDNLDKSRSSIGFKRCNVLAQDNMQYGWNQEQIDRSISHVSEAESKLGEGDLQDSETAPVDDVSGKMDYQAYYELEGLINLEGHNVFGQGEIKGNLSKDQDEIIDEDEENLAKSRLSVVNNVSRELGVDSVVKQIGHNKTKYSVIKDQINQSNLHADANAFSENSRDEGSISLERQNYRSILENDGIKDILLKDQPIGGNWCTYESEWDVDTEDDNGISANFKMLTVTNVHHNKSNIAEFSQTVENRDHMAAAEDHVGTWIKDVDSNYFECRTWQDASEICYDPCKEARCNAHVQDLAHSLPKKENFLAFNENAFAARHCSIPVEDNGEDSLTRNMVCKSSLVANLDKYDNEDKSGPFAGNNPVKAHDFGPKNAGSQCWSTGKEFSQNKNGTMLGGLDEVDGYEEKKNSVPGSHFNEDFPPLKNNKPRDPCNDYKVASMHGNRISSSSHADIVNVPHHSESGLMDFKRILSKLKRIDQQQKKPIAVTSERQLPSVRVMDSYLDVGMQQSLNRTAESLVEVREHSSKLKSIIDDLNQKGGYIEKLSMLRARNAELIKSNITMAQEVNALKLELVEIKFTVLSLSSPSW